MIAMVALLAAALPSFAESPSPMPQVDEAQSSVHNGPAADTVQSEQQFDALARIEGAGRFIELPQLMFALDRSLTPPKVHWIDTRRYIYHFDYLQSRYLTLADSDTFNAANYSQANRRFILGSVLRYPRLGKYGVELWEGDEIQPELLRMMMTQLQNVFFAPLTFKPNSGQQQIAADVASLPVIGIDEAYGSRDQLVLNRGRAVGRLIRVKSGEENRLMPGDIALLDDMPIRMPPVAGIISATFSTPINHVSLLAKTWGIPNVYLAQANERWHALEGHHVVLDATGASVTVRPATAREVSDAARIDHSRSIRTPRADPGFVGLPALVDQDAGWAKRTGAKAANLGQVAALTRKGGEGFTVPPGFSIPFAFYDRFVSANDLQSSINAFLTDPRRNDAGWREKALSALRADFAKGFIPETDMSAIITRQTGLLGDAGLFVRSSTNAEDLPGFNGAGLYDTVPNVSDNGMLSAAIKTVWGSIWNDRAYLAREAARIDHRAVRPAILMQAGIDADASGVMTTIDPFDEQSDERRIFIAAKRGIGIRVVEGKKIAEQIIYRRDLDSIQILTRSHDDVMLHFDPNGGVQEVKIDPSRPVLTDDLVRRLATIGSAIQGQFGGRPQDIEWLIAGGQIMIVQSRDYVRGTK